MTENKSWNDATNGAAANEDGWHDVEAEDQIIVETEGEGFTARYMGMDPPNANGIVQGHFTGVYTLDDDPFSERAFMNLTTDLRNKLKNVPIRSQVRCQWKSSMDTGHESGTKMRVWNVQWR